MDPIRVAIIGCGRVSQRYKEVFRDELRGARVVAVCDKVLTRAQDLGAALNCPATHDAHEILRRTDVDLVVILTESGNHADHARTALMAGKHVVVEKPAALFPDEIYELAQMAEQKSLMYSVIFQNRFNPAMRALKLAWDRGRFGTLVVATVRVRWCRTQNYYADGWHGTWAMDGGVINQQAIHHIDALQWICGLPTQVVSSQARRANVLEAEDTTVALANFPGGGLGIIEATTAARPRDFEASMSIVGTGGTVVVGGIALNRVESWEFVERFPEDDSACKRHSQEVPTGYGLSHGPLLQDVIDRLQRGIIVPPVTAIDGASSVRIVHALYRSAEVGNWVALYDQPLSSRLGSGRNATVKSEKLWIKSEPSKTNIPVKM